MDERAELYETYSEMHKELYGVRARFAHDWTVAELREGIEQLLEEHESAPDSGEGWQYEGDPQSLEC